MEYEDDYDTSLRAWIFNAWMRLVYALGVMRCAHTHANISTQVTYSGRNYETIVTTHVRACSACGKKLEPMMVAYDGPDEG